MNEETKRVIDWSAYPGPEDYQPRDVDAAFDSLCEAATPEQAAAAHSNLLFAIGNNHAGTFYPAAVSGIAVLIDLALGGDELPNRTAFSILGDLASFEPEPGYEEFVGPSGESVNLDQALLAQLRGVRDSLLDVVRQPDAHEPSRVIALELLEHIDEDPSDLAGLLRTMPERSDHGNFDGARRRFLLEYGYI